MQVVLEALRRVLCEIGYKCNVSKIRILLVARNPIFKLDLNLVSSQHLIRILKPDKCSDLALFSLIYWPNPHFLGFPSAITLNLSSTWIMFNLNFHNGSDPSLFLSFGNDILRQALGNTLFGDFGWCNFETKSQQRLWNDLSLNQDFWNFSSTWVYPG